jgi:antitoxin component YwqK of YwqJK toxin-antitoxin module
MKNIFLLIIILNIPPHLYSQEVFEKKDLNYNNYDNKYYNKGVPFSGKMKVMIEANKGYYIITYKGGVVNGKIMGYNEEGKLSHNFSYLDGHFDGEFDTPHAIGILKKDTLVADFLFLSQIDGRGIPSKLSFYYFNYSDTSKKYSRILESGSLVKEGILPYRKYVPTYSVDEVDDFGLVNDIQTGEEGILPHPKSYPAYLANDFGLDINDILRGKNTYFSDVELRLPDMHHLTTYYPKSKKVKSKEFYKDDSLLIAKVNYYDITGKVLDSTAFLHPKNVYAKEISKKDAAKHQYDKFYISYFNTGKIREKYTQKINSPVEENPNSLTFEVNPIYINEYVKSFDNGNLSEKRFYNENGKLDSEYIAYYESGKSKYIANFKNGECIMPFFYYRPSGILRYSITKDENGEWLYQELMPDGYLKFKKVLTSKEIQEISNGLLYAHRIGDYNREYEPFKEDDNILNDLINPNSRDW